jgi:hypothetical protein
MEWFLVVGFVILCCVIAEHAGYLRGIRDTERRWHAAHERRERTDG